MRTLAYTFPVHILYSSLPVTQLMYIQVTLIIANTQTSAEVKLTFGKCWFIFALSSLRFNSCYLKQKILIPRSLR